MSVLPILFNTDMVQAIITGRKTVTRRVAKFPVNNFTEKLPNPNEVSVQENTIHSEKVFFHEEPHYCFEVKPPYTRGDILYVRETWNKLPFTGKYIYKADDSGSDIIPDGVIGHLKYKPSIHMPKEAARIWLKVIDVRVEQLQDITEQQAVQEGINVCKAVHDGYTDGREAFATLWNSTIKKQDIEIYGWKANPWVWVIEFERCDKPEEES